VIIALAGIDGSLVAEELVGGGGKSLAGGDNASWALLGKDLVADPIPDLNLGTAQAAEAPFIVDEGVDESALGGIGREMVLVILSGEQGEAFSGLVPYDQGLVALDAAFDGRWAGAFWSVAAVGRELFDSCHKIPRLKVSSSGNTKLQDHFSKLFGMMQLTIFEAL
jgi:hypothetical protein